MVTNNSSEMFLWTAWNIHSLVAMLQMHTVSARVSHKQTQTKLSTRTGCSHLEWFQTAPLPAPYKHTVLCISGNPAEEGFWGYAVVRVYCTDPLHPALCTCMSWCVFSWMNQGQNWTRATRYDNVILQDKLKTLRKPSPASSDKAV